MMKDEKKTKAQLIDELNRLRQQLDEHTYPGESSGNVEDMLRLYENIVSVTKDRLAFVDRNYVYRAVNLSYARAANRTRDEVLGNTLPDVLGKEVFKDFVKGYIDRCLAGESVRYQSWFDSPVSGQEYMDVRYQPVFNSDGSVEGVVVSSRDITDHKNAEDLRIKEAAAEARSEELKHTRQRIVAAQESLRRSLAQQLHGTVQTKIIFLLFRLTEIKKQVSDQVILDSLNELSSEIENLLELDIRSISHQLYPFILRQGIGPALRSLGDQFEKHLSVKIEIDEEIAKREQVNHQTIPEIVKLTAYRIVEESLNNVIKHSHSTETVIKLKYLNRRRLELSIEDNGQGFDVAHTGPGFGLSIIYSYADMIGGNCAVQSIPGKGTLITAKLPLQKRKYLAVEF